MFTYLSILIMGFFPGQNHNHVFFLNFRGRNYLNKIIIKTKFILLYYYNINFISIEYIQK